MADSGYTQILIYALNYADRMLEEVPYLRYSTERSLGYLWRLRNPAERAVVVTSEPVDPYTLEYHFRDVFGFDDRTAASARDRLTLLTPASHRVRPLDDLVLADDGLVRALRDAAGTTARAEIVHFMASDSLDELARQTGAELDEGPVRLAARWGSKAGSKEILLRAGVPVPRGGAGLLRSEQEVAAAVADLTAALDRPRHVLVKLSASTWAASVGNVLVDCEKYAATGDLLGSAEVVRMPAREFRRELAAGGAIVEEFLEDVTSSPSGQGHIAADGTVRVVSSHDQVLSGGQYWGCRYPAGERWRPVLTDAVARTGAVLAEVGHRGSFGVDFVIAGERGPLAVEINLRKVGPSHVLRYAEALVGREADTDGTLRRPDGQPVAYVHGRILDPEALGRLDPETAVERLRDLDLLYRRDRGEGVALHVLGALKTCGFVEITALAATPEAAERYSEAARTALLRPAWPDR
ncbi:L-propargylglycine--L-glutamate ligase BesA [Streptomyces sp. NPDC017082]|uniref:L-propargylglycine--L-glutamate ligase BesA n=1 Tax=Streptomyces sp. NPDC017082 TaxID=3364974 RepID=UPI0037938DBC